jgi:hypothetical protein
VRDGAEETRCEIPLFDLATGASDLTVPVVAEQVKPDEDSDIWGVLREPRDTVYLDPHGVMAGASEAGRASDGDGLDPFGVLAAPPVGGLLEATQVHAETFCRPGEAGGVSGEARRGKRKARRQQEAAAETAPKTPGEGAASSGELVLQAGPSETGQDRETSEMGFSETPRRRRGLPDTLDPEMEVVEPSSRPSKKRSKARVPTTSDGLVDAVSAPGLPGDELGPVVPRPPRGVSSVRAPRRTAALNNFDMGVIEMMAGESQEHRVAIPIGDEEDLEGAKVRATVEQGDGRVKILNQQVVGTDLVVTMGVLSPLHGDFAIKLRVDAGWGRTLRATAMLKVSHVPQPPLDISGPVGGQATTEVPLAEQQWKTVSFQAVIEPPVREFKLSQSSGEVEAGSKVFPFRLTFTPREAKTVTALLVITFDEGPSEYVVELRGIGSGVQGRAPGKRSRVSQSPESLI